MIEHVSRLPAEYQEVTHIQTNGEQFFDTDFISNQDTRVIWKGEWLAASSAAWIFGVRTAVADEGFTMLTTSGKFRSDYGNTDGVYFSSSITTAYKIDKNKHATTINDAETVTSTYEAFQCPKTLKLFACDTDGTIAGYSTAKTTATEIYDNGTLVRDYVPCYRKADNVAGLYDLVNGVFGTFEGTAPVTVGEDVALTITTVIPKNWVLRRRMMISGSCAPGELGVPTVDTSTGIVTVTVTKGGVLKEGTSTTLQLSKQAAKIVTPSASTQTAVAKGKYTTGAVTVAAIPSGSNIPVAAGSFTLSTPTATKTISGLKFAPIGILLFCVGGNTGRDYLHTLYDLKSTSSTDHALKAFSTSLVNYYSCSYTSTSVTITCSSGSNYDKLYDGYNYVIWGAAS